MTAQVRPDFLLTHNVFPVGSPSLYHAAHRLRVPVIQYAHNYRPFSVGGTLFVDGKNIDEPLHGKYWREIRHGAWQQSVVKSAVFALSLKLLHRSGWLDSVKAWICVSEFMRGKFVAAGLPPEKVHAIPIAVEAPFTPDGPRAEGDYVLSVGTLEPRKNLARVQQAARALAVPLRVVGAEGWGEVKVEGWVGRVSDEELAALYRGARCLVYPSLYEGFGLPVLEAMACGTPVVTSRGGATEEVAGDAAVLVDPLDVDAIGAGIQEALTRGDELRAKGLERAQAFSWDRVARGTWAVYEQVAA
jgi:glycosyltransferase involved in cell wall biosynthesis